MRHSGMGGFGKLMDASLWIGLGVQIGALGLGWFWHDLFGGFEA